MDLEKLTVSASLIIGFLGLVWGVYTHLSTRKIAKIRYEVRQLTDFDLPDTFLDSLTTLPVNIIVDNVGNKKAEDIHIWVELTTKILDYSIEAGVEYRARKTENCIQIDNLSLNPTESLSVSIQCKRDPDRSNYVSNIKITHSEGIGLNFQDTEFQVEEVIESVFKSVIWRI